MSTTLDVSYFTNYCGAGSYDDNYLAYSGVDHCIDIIDRFKIRIASVAVLGAATGRILRHFEQAWDVRPEGCEINPWAHSRIPRRYRTRIMQADQLEYVPRVLSAGRQFDLIFGNALIYLKESDIDGLLAQCSQICRYYHFLSSTSESFEPGDKYRVTLRPRHWWRQRFIAAGFLPTRSPYLFRAST
ncbi:MAG: class I SAM-dependent methyltransferase [Gammaproteobacteria bacterium]|nr:class I SAM-dependent methyltransferase [Gammaproteobacteria bacterium]